MKKKLVLGLGSNIGNRYAYLLQAIHRLREATQEDLHVAKIYETPPWGDTKQSRFLNTAVYLETSLSIKETFQLIKEIETLGNRLKTRKWGPRSIDIDILFYSEEIVETEFLTVPHKYLHERAFVLAPLVDILPDFKHPITGLKMSKYLDQMDLSELSIFAR